MGGHHADSSVAGADASATALLDTLASLLRKTVAPLLDGMFSNCDKTLFDLASGAVGTHDEQRLLDFRRELQHKRSSIATRFVQQLMSGFSRFQRPPPTDAMPNSEELSLVPQEQLERQLLIANGVSRVRNEAQLALAHLHERMRSLTPTASETSESENPLDPGHIARAFLDACEEIESDIRCLRLLCQQFDTHVLGSLDDVYQRSNEVLIDARILPLLGGMAKRSTQAKIKTATASQTSAATTAGGAPLPAAASVTGAGYGELSALLQRVRGAGSTLPFTTTLATGAGPVSGIALGAEELVRLLGDVLLESPHPDNGLRVPVDIRTAMESVALLRGSSQLGVEEHNVVDIVTLIFDAVTVDRDLPQAVQALLSQLQLPVLKLALVDREFFSDREHPARQLINTIARAGQGWDGHDQGAQDTLLRQMQTLLAELAARPRAEREAFVQVLLHLQGHIEHAEQRAIKLERRTSEKAVADARLSAARNAVHAVMQQKLDGCDLAIALLDFFNTDWQRTLQLFFLRKGVDSQEWQDAVAMLEDLPRSLVSPRDVLGRGALQRMLPTLYERIAQALEKTQGNTIEAQARIDAIRRLHAELIETPIGSEARVIPIERARIQAPPMIPPRARDMPPVAQVQALGDDTVPRAVLNLESMQRADAITVGTWFEISDRTGVTRRCKLSSRVDETRTLLFCDRNGRLVHEASRKAFAYALQTGDWRILEDEPLLDRTLERIAGDLRRRIGVA